MYLKILFVKELLIHVMEVIQTLKLPQITVRIKTVTVMIKLNITVMYVLQIIN